MGRALCRFWVCCPLCWRAWEDGVVILWASRWISLSVTFHHWDKNPDTSNLKKRFIWLMVSS